MTVIVPLESEVIKAISSAANLALSCAINIFGKGEEWKGRSGGYLCIANGNTGDPYLVIPVGGMREGKAEEYCRFAQEKARRLAANPSHESSWQSRNVEAKQYGGAIRMDKFIYSFSGLPELVDEAVMAVLCGVLARKYSRPRIIETVTRILAVSGNQYWGELWDEVDSEVEFQHSMDQNAGT